MPKKATARRRWWKTFAVTLTVSLCVLGLGVACLAIECNMQQTRYGRVELGVSYHLEEGIPRLEGENGGELAALSPGWRQALWGVVAAPVRLTAELLQRETQAAARLWEQIFAAKE